jgi:hypothetical protein
MPLDELAANRLVSLNPGKERRVTIPLGPAVTISLGAMSPTGTPREGWPNGRFLRLAE